MNYYAEAKQTVYRGRMLKKTFLLAGLFLSFTCMVFLLGCARNQKKLIAKTVGETVLRPYSEAVKMQQWEVAQQYLTDDVQITVKNQQGTGKAYVIEWLKNSPARRFSGLQADAVFLEVDPQRVTARLKLAGSRKTSGGTEFLNISVRIRVMKKGGRWLIHELIYDTFEVL